MQKQSCLNASLIAKELFQQNKRRLLKQNAEILSCSLQKDKGHKKIISPASEFGSPRLPTARAKLPLLTKKRQNKLHNNDKKNKKR